MEIRRNVLKRQAVLISSMDGDGLNVRVASAVVALPPLILLVWVGAPWFTAIVALAASLGALELSVMANGVGRRIVGPVLAVWMVASVAAGQLVSDGYPVGTTLLPALAGGAVVSLVLVMRQDRSMRQRLIDWSLSVAAAIYLGGILAHAPLLRGLQQGREWVLMLLVVTFATDTGAYAVGKAIGRHRLAPSISPGKTWEGFIGGITVAIGVGYGMASAFNLGSGSANVLALGAMIGFAGQVGDLLESKIKRIAGVEDSGWMIPGHGGVLDRMDSIVLNLVVVYHFVRWVLL